MMQRRPAEVEKETVNSRKLVSEFQVTRFVRALNSFAHILSLYLAFIEYSGSYVTLTLAATSACYLCVLSCRQVVAATRFVFDRVCPKSSWAIRKYYSLSRDFFGQGTKFRPLLLQSKCRLGS